MSKYTTEKLYEVWNDDTGDHYEIGNDRDALDLIEIRAVSREKKITDRLTMEPDAASKVAHAILKYLGEE